MGIYQAEFRAVQAFARGEALGDGQSDTLVYGRGPSLRGAPIAGAVRGLVDAGLVSANFRRGVDGIGEYVITRRTGVRPPKRPVRARGPQLDEVERAVLRLLKRYARAGQDLPTNRSIAARCGCKNRYDASYRIRKLVAAGLILIESFGDLGAETRKAVLPAPAGEGK